MRTAFRLAAIASCGVRLGERGAHAIELTGGAGRLYAGEQVLLSVLGGLTYSFLLE